MPRKSVEVLVPEGTLKTFIVKVASLGVWWARILIRITKETTRIRATVMPSTLSSTDAARLAGTTARKSARARATKPTRKPDQSGGLFQTPMMSRNADPKMPAADDVTRA